LGQGHKGPLLFSAVFIAQEVDGVRDKGSGDITTFNVQTLLEAFVNMLLRSACFIDEVFLDKKQNFQPWGYSPEVLDYQNFRITGHQIKATLLYLEV
jgi:hypothetical protein